MKKAFFTFLVILIANSQLPTAVTARTDWPEFMGDAQNTGSTESQVAAMIPSGCYPAWTCSNNPSLQAWKRNLGAPINGRSQPIIVNQTLYQGTMSGTFFALNTSDGTIKWQTTLSGSIVGTPLLSGSRIFVPSTSGRIYALDISTGSTVWTFDSQDLASTPKVMRGQFTAGVKLLDDVLFVGNNNRYFYAINAVNGTLKWKFKAASRIYNPAALTNGKVFFMSDAGFDPRLGSGRENATAAYALDTKTGNLLWAFPLRGEAVRQTYPIIIGDQVVFLHSQGGPAQAAQRDGFMPDPFDYNYYWGFRDKSYEDSFTDSGNPSGFGSLSNLLRVAADYYKRYPTHQAVSVINIPSGQESTYTYNNGSGNILPISSLYVGFTLPKVYQHQLLAIQYYQLYKINLTTGQFTNFGLARNDMNGFLLRGDEFAAFTVAGNQLLTAGAAVYQSLNLTNTSQRTAVQLYNNSPFGSPGSWEPDNSVNSTVYNMESQWGNGYVGDMGEPIAYDDKIIFTYRYGWVYAYKGTRQTPTSSISLSPSTLQLSPNQASSPVTIRLSAAPASPLTVTLFSSSSTGSVSTSSSTWVPVTQITVSPGQTQATIYYKNSASGGPFTLTAEAPNYLNGVLRIDTSGTTSLPTPRDLLLNWLSSQLDQTSDAKVNTLDFAKVIY